MKNQTNKKVVKSESDHFKLGTRNAVEIRQKEFSVSLKGQIL